MSPRVGAGTYLLAMSSAINAWCLAMIGLLYYAVVPNVVSRTFAEYMAWALGALVGYIFFYLSRRRLQDLNVPGTWARILAFPLFGVIILPVLCFMSGPRYSNDFGDPPQPSGVVKIAGALASFFAAVVLVPYATILYASSRAF